MSFLTTIYSRMVETRRSQRGQTMTEYALILATIAAVVISLYHTSGTIVSGLLVAVDGSL